VPHEARAAFLIEDRFARSRNPFSGRKPVSAPNL